jgi:hypothetical protein
MRDAPKLPPDARPLRLVPGYCITDDGRVFRSKDGKAVTALGLRDARGHAREAIEFDGHLMSRQPFGALPPEQLVYMDRAESGPEDGPTVFREVEMVQLVRLPSKREREPRARGAHFTVSSAYFAGGPMLAAGDTRRLWYQLKHDGAMVLFHGPSLAAHERQHL